MPPQGVCDDRVRYHTTHQAFISPGSRTLLSAHALCVRASLEHGCNHAHLCLPPAVLMPCTPVVPQASVTVLYLLQVQGLGASIGSRPSVSRGQLQVRAAESKDTSSEPLSLFGVRELHCA
jgi:hypothetical protein